MSPDMDLHPLATEIAGLPKVELHRHMEGALGFDTIVELLKLHGQPVPGIEEIKVRSCVRRPMKSLQEVLDCFGFFGSLLDSRAALEIGVRGAVRQAAREGIVYYEMRFSPGFIGNWCHLPLSEITSTVLDTAGEASREFGIEVPAILICTKELGVHSCMETFGLAVSCMDRGVVGVDLAGDEDGAPLSDFAGACQMALEAGLRVTVHAGETGRHENIRTAVQQLGASRIGHGIAAVNSPETMAMLKERSIPLEVSVTSNWLIGACASTRVHPAGELMRQGVKLVFNTDDPTLFDIDLNHELALVSDHWDKSLADLLALQHRALDHAFGSRDAVDRARARLDAFLPQH